MLPTIDEALNELKIASEMNPGPWVKHSENVGIAAKNIAHLIPELDEDKAYIVGLLHDIGRRVGIVNIPKHVYEGYKYCMEKGWDEAARVCMTHSYVSVAHKKYFYHNAKTPLFPVFSRLVAVFIVLDSKHFFSNCHVFSYVSLCKSGKMSGK